MAGLFSGLELGKRALSTNQLWLNTIGHNIANVDTPGFSRQRVNIATSSPEQHYAGLLGTGVRAVNISSIRDMFLSQQYRDENKNLGEWTSKEKMMTRIENIFMEPSTDSLGDLLEGFWTSWSELSNNPESIAARTTIQEQANLVANGFHQRYEQLQTLQNSIDIDVELIVQNINSMADEIASLNSQISGLELGNTIANDLRDRRGLLLDELSQYIDVNTSEQGNGAVYVYVGSMMIVDDTTAIHIDTKERAGNGYAVSDIVWEGTSRKITSLNGELKGLLETRDTTIPKYLEDLDDLAQTLITSVNGLHSAGYDLDGYTGIDFFDEHYMSAGTIRISQDIANDVTKIAASQSGAIGDNSNAVAISELRNAMLLTNGTATMEDYYNIIVGKVGIETDKAVQLKENYTLLVEQVENARQSVQGVSLDEEMTNMIKYQQAFDAAARVITTMDQALDTVIKDMGVVGR